MLLRFSLPLFVIFGLCHSGLKAQTDSIAKKVPAQFIEQVTSKASGIEKMLDKKSVQIISDFRRQEAKLQRKLAKKDSSKANEVFGNAKEQYSQLQQKLDKANKFNQYIPSLDTLCSSLAFLRGNPQLLTLTKEGSAKLNEAVVKVNDLQSEFQKAEEIKKFLKERKQYLRDKLSNLGMAKQLKRINKQAYYYTAQVNEYKALIRDHKKAERKAFELLSKTKLFKDFISKNSLLSPLFRLPSGQSGTAPTNFGGLQTRAQVNNLIQQQIAAGGSNAQAQFSQNMQQAQNQLNSLKSKLTQIGGSGDLEVPEGFKPNPQKTKSFFQRIEVGANMQSQKSNGYFPVTSDFGLSAGYKLNDISIIGLGVSYKMGWGQSIRNIRITHQGIGLRSFIDIKLKSSFWLSGGYEMNYRSGFSRFTELKDRNAWQESGLIGVSKVLSIKSKILKKTKFQLLWDFLSYSQVPKPTAVIFRVGYTF